MPRQDRYTTNSFPKVTFIFLQAHTPFHCSKVYLAWPATTTNSPRTWGKHWETWKILWYVMWNKWTTMTALVVIVKYNNKPKSMSNIPFLPTSTGTSSDLLTDSFSAFHLLLSTEHHLNRLSWYRTCPSPQWENFSYINNVKERHKAAGLPCKNICSKAGFGLLGVNIAVNGYNPHLCLGRNRNSGLARPSPQWKQASQVTQICRPGSANVIILELQRGKQNNDL